MLFTKTTLEVFWLTLYKKFFEGQVTYIYFEFLKIFRAYNFPPKIVWIHSRLEWNHTNLVWIHSIEAFGQKLVQDETNCNTDIKIFIVS